MSENLNVLLVDDDVDTCAVMERILSLENIHCNTAHSVDSALQMLGQPTAQSEQGYDVVLLDLLLPGAPPEELVEAIRQQKNAGKRPRVLVFSASNKAEFETEKLGADGCIAKPFEVESLLEQIQNI